MSHEFNRRFESPYKLLLETSSQNTSLNKATEEFKRNLHTRKSEQIYWQRIYNIFGLKTNVTKPNIDEDRLMELDMSKLILIYIP